jgi:endonuclease III
VVWYPFNLSANLRTEYCNVPIKKQKQSAVSHQPSGKKTPAAVSPQATNGRHKSRNTKPETRNSSNPKRVAEILKRLEATYGGATCALHHKNAWELLVATILSAQCTDVRVNMTTPELFRQYPDAAHLSTAKPEDIEPIIKSTGFFRNKSKSIVGAAKAVTEEFGGEVPNDMEKLLSLPGVARKTANVVLGTWFKRNEGVVVDTHVYRISRRLELTKGDNPKDIEEDLMRVIPREKWTDFSHQVIWHGRALCIARRPKCAECLLENICHAADKTWSTVEIHKSAKP